MKVFIIARIGTDTSIIRRILLELHVAAEDAFDFHGESTLRNSLRERMAAADFVIAALDKAPDVQVSYELGLSDAMNKPILVIAPANLDLPPFLRRFIQVRAKTSSERLLEVALRSFVESLHEPQNYSYSRVPADSERQQRVDSKRIQALAYRVKTKRARLRGEEAEATAANLFKELGLTTVAQSSHRPERVDMAVWANTLDPTFGNQVLIEVKAGSLTAKILDSAEIALREALRRARAQVGLLLYVDRSGKRFTAKRPTDPLVLRFDLEDFAKRAGEESFDRILLAERNRLVHSGF